jgi:hypothetical protein
MNNLTENRSKVIRVVKWSLILSCLATILFGYTGGLLTNSTLPGPGAGYGPSLGLGILAIISAIWFFVSLILFILLRTIK